MLIPSQLHEIVKRLIGPISPVGETNEDSKRYENLDVFTDVADELFRDIYNVATQYESSPRASEKKAGDAARKYLMGAAEWCETDQWQEKLLALNEHGLWMLFHDSGQWKCQNDDNQDQCYHADTPEEAVASAFAAVAA